MKIIKEFNEKDLEILNRPIPYCPCSADDCRVCITSIVTCEKYQKYKKQLKLYEKENLEDIIDALANYKDAEKECVRLYNEFLKITDYKLTINSIGKVDFANRRNKTQQSMKINIIE